MASLASGGSGSRMIRRIFGALALLAVAACSGPDSGGGRPEIDPALAAQIPPDAEVVKDIEIGVKGGQLIMATAGEIKTFNEPLSSDTSSSLVTSFLWSSLTGFDNVTQLEKPALAKSWEYNEETREWTFHIREGLRWSDGTPLTSDDFMFYTELVRDPAVGSQLADYFKTDDKPFEFSAPDPLTFVAKIPAVDSFAFLNLGLIKAFPRHKYEGALKAGKFAEILGTDTKPEDVVGSGPFVLKEYVSGERIVLSANPYYYKFDEKGQRLPYADQLVILIVPDADAMELRFQAGDIDYLEGIQPENLVTIQDGAEQGNYTVYESGLSLTNNFYWFNLKPGGSYAGAGGERLKWVPEDPNAEPPADIKAKDFKYFIDPAKRKLFDMVEFRRACSMATDRDAIVKTILFGEGEAVYGPVVQSNKIWHSPDIPIYPYDPAKAKATLDSIGFKDRNGDGKREAPDGSPFRFTILTNKESGTREKVGVLIQENLAAVGLDASLQLLDFNNLLSRVDDNYDYDACLLGIASGVPPHPAMGANSWLSSGRLHQWNPEQPAPSTEWEAEIDRLYESMKATFDLQEQVKIHAEMQRIQSEQVPQIHLMSQNAFVAVTNRIGNIKPSPLRPPVTHNIEEHYIKP